jgi:hypothetical protein
MRYFCYNEPHLIGHNVAVMSEEDIRRDYYPIWYERMCAKFGKDKVDNIYSFQECLEDWCTVHWAWESTDDENS